MLRLRTREGVTLRAKTHAGLVVAMRKQQWHSVPGKGRYMRQVKDRVYELTGKVVRVSSPTDFLTDLVALGLVTVMLES